MTEAEAVMIGRHALCEFAWVLRTRCRFTKNEAAEAIQRLRGIGNVVLDSASVDSGPPAMEAGADFADGVIAYEGRWLGGAEFVSFDKKAVDALARLGQKTRLLT